MSGDRAETKTPGEFRRDNNHIAAQTTRIEDGDLRASPYQEIAYLHEPSLKTSINGRVELPPLVREATDHYHLKQFTHCPMVMAESVRLLLTLGLVRR
jgi:hypothetical protein